MAENMMRKKSDEEGELKGKVTDQKMEISGKAEPEAPWRKPKNGSVLPKKRKSVKTMMCECVVQCVADTCCSNKIASAFKQGSSVHPYSSNP